MIIFVSDLHLTDGTFDYDGMVHDTSAGAYEMFWNDILSIVDANKDEGANVQKIKVVLLGDILELRTTTRWMKAKTRPWLENPNELSREALDVLSQIIKNIIFEDPAIGQLRQRSYYLSNRYPDRIDAQNGLRRLLERNVEVSFVYVPGNHDRMILVGNDKQLRDIITDNLGWEIVGPDTLPGFPNEPRFRYPGLGIVANHGHGVDTIDFFNDYLQPTIGDLLPDIVGRMMNHAKNLEHINPVEKKEIVRVILNLDLVRPSRSQFAWLMQKIKSLESGSADPGISAINKGLQEILVNTLKELLDSSDAILEFLYPRIEDKAKKFGAVAISAFLLKDPAVLLCLFRKKKDALKSLLKKIVGNVVERLEKDPKKLLESFERMATNINGILPEKKKKGSKEEDYALELLKEKDCSFVLFGHTHDYEICPMGTGKDGFYFNTGTWKKTVVKNYPASDESGFQRWARMTYVIFFDKGENKDHAFDLWHGNLQFEEDKFI